MVLSTPKFTKIIRLGLLVQLRYYRLGLQPAGGGAGVCRSPRLRKEKGLGGPGTASSPFRKSRGRGGPTRKGAETESSPKAQYGTNATDYGLIFLAYGGPSHFSRISLILTCWVLWFSLKKSLRILILPAPLHSFLTSVCVIIIPSVSSFKFAVKMVNRTRQRTEPCVIAWRNSSSKLTVNFNPDVTSWHPWVVLGLQACFVGHSHSVWFLDGMSLPHTMASPDSYLL